MQKIHKNDFNNQNLLFKMQIFLGRALHSPLVTPTPFGVGSTYSVASHKKLLLFTRVHFKTDTPTLKRVGIPT